MTVATSYAPLSYSGNGSTTSFAITWPFFATSDIVAIIIDADGVETTKTLTTHYTVSGGTTVDGLPATGSLTMVSAPATGETLRIHRATNKVQSATWTNGGSFHAKTIEATADRLMLIAQEMGASGIGGGGDAPAIDGTPLLFESSGVEDYFDARNNIIRNVADPVSADDAVNKSYGDINYGGAAAASAAASAVSAASSATAASSAKTAAEAALDAFDDRYLGAKASDPLVDNDGAALVDGAAYWNTTSAELRIYDTATNQFYGPTVSSVNGQTGAVTLNLGNIEDLNLAPSGSPSVGEGSLYVRSVRTGGNGQYGNALYYYVVEDEIPSGQFDVGVTSWASSENQTGGHIFGSWVGANTPYTSIGHTYTGGGTIGQEINVGNRAADFGLLTDIGSGRWVVGQQIVPDVVPSPDAPPTAYYPGSFAQVISASIHGHKWWTGHLTRTDALMPGGVHWRVGGGSVVGNAALALMSVSGYWTTGIDLTPATISGNAYASDGFSVSGSGAVTAASVAASGAVSGASVAASGGLTGSTLATTGNASIGGATASARLDVAGTHASPSLSSDVGIFEMTSSTSAQLVAGCYNGGAYPVWIQTKQSSNSGNSFPLHINPLGGNIGIGVAVTDSVTAKLHVNGAIRHASSTVAGLPSASSSGVGSRYLVTDANATTFAAVVAGGGANVVPVFSDGTNWRIG